MDIFSFQSYKRYLEFKLGPLGLGRGAKSDLAKFLNCQSGFISQVIKGDAQLSLEHSISTARYLRLGEDEENYFMLLIQFEKAGSKELAEYFKKEIKKRIDERKQIKKRLDIKDVMTSEQQSKYYSSWIYAAVHVALLIPKLRTIQSISKRLNLSPSRVHQVLDELVEWKLANHEGDEYRASAKRLHVGSSSPELFKHQQNWRIEAIKSIEKNEMSHIHYSGVLAFSKEDSQKIREIFLKSISEMEVVIRPSPEEELYVVNLDFFTL